MSGAFFFCALRAIHLTASPFFVQMSSVTPVTPVTPVAPVAPAPASVDTGVEKMSAGMGLFVYGVVAVFVVLLLFGLCVAADSMGRYTLSMFKRFAFADGAGNVSLLTEIVVFLVVVVVAAVVLSMSFHTAASRTIPAAPTSSSAPAPANTQPIVAVNGVRAPRRLL